jgi:DNA replication protein DnaC
MYPQVKSTWRASPPVLAREDCPLCHGAGWELLSIPGPLRVRRCPCGMLARIAKLKEEVRVPRRYEHCSLDNFHPQTHSQVRALAEARRFIGRYPHVSKGLFFAGPPGVGKTHLAVGIILELLQHFQEDILFADFRALAASLRSPTKFPVEQLSSLARLKTVSLLVLDNIDVTFPRAGNLRLVQEIIRARMRSRRLTVCTCNRLQGNELSMASPSGDVSFSAMRRSGILPESLVHLEDFVKVVPVSGGDYRKGSLWQASLLRLGSRASRDGRQEG